MRKLILVSLVIVISVGVSMIPRTLVNGAKTLVSNYNKSNGFASSHFDIRF